MIASLVKNKEVCMKKTLLMALLLVTQITFAASANFLFLETATEGKLIKNKDNSFSLILPNVPTFMGYFSDRPERKAGIISLKEFLKLWSDKKLSDNFSENPPNVAITFKPKAGKAENFIAEVSNPIYKNKTLTYTIKPISKQSIQLGDISHLHLFFDDIHWNPGGF